MTPPRKLPHRYVGVADAMADTGKSDSWCRTRLKALAKQLGRSPSERGALLIPRRTWDKFVAGRYGAEDAECDFGSVGASGTSDSGTAARESSGAPVKRTAKRRRRSLSDSSAKPPIRLTRARWGGP